jgi:hypothetical protein
MGRSDRDGMGVGSKRYNPVTLEAVTEPIMTPSDPAMPSRWSLARVLILILAGSFLGLMADIRVEHVEVVHKTRLAWVPIIYSAAMAVACVLAATFWNDTARLLIQIVCLVGLIIGGLGFYLHNHGKIANAITSSADAWIDPKMKHPHGPPQSAPLAFAGLGLLGVVATLKRFN